MWGGGGRQGGRVEEVDGMVQMGGRWSRLQEQGGELGQDREMRQCGALGPRWLPVVLKKLLLFLFSVTLRKAAPACYYANVLNCYFCYLLC